VLTARGQVGAVAVAELVWLHGRKRADARGAAAPRLIPAALAAHVLAGPAGSVAEQLGAGAWAGLAVRAGLEAATAATAWALHRRFVAAQEAKRS
jgi:hypothetical protein